MDATPITRDEVDYNAPTEEYRAENYDALPKPVVTPTGVPAESQTVEHRAPDYDQMLARGGEVAGTFRDRIETKVITPSDSKAETK